MRTLLGVLQLIRLPLLLTALADASVVAVVHHGGLAWDALVPLWVCAAGLYVFGMAGNDWFDRASDREAMQAGSAGRANPIVAGLVPDVVALGVVMLSGVAAVVVASLSPHVNEWATLAGLAMALAYNAGGKRLPPLGLLLLGGGRAANAGQGILDPATMPYWAVPAVLGFHVVFVSAFAYAWERKRPSLYGNNWLYLLAGCGVVLAAMGLAKQTLGTQYWPAGKGIAAVAAAWVVFLALFVFIFLKVPRLRRGPTLVLMGLSWLIVLDWAFCYAAGLPQTGALFGALLAGVYAARIGMRRLARVLQPKAAAPPARTPRRRRRR